MENFREVGVSGGRKTVWSGVTLDKWREWHEKNNMDKTSGKSEMYESVFW